MEPHLKPTPQFDNTQQAQPEEAPRTMPDAQTTTQAHYTSGKKTNTITCAFGGGGIILLLLFIFLGGKIFGFFHIENVYHFILSLMIFIVIYIVGVIVPGLFTKAPRDLLTIVYDRLRT